MSAAVPVWDYQAPDRPESAKRQCYYRAARNLAFVIGALDTHQVEAEVFRWVESDRIRVALSIGYAASVQAEIDIAGAVLLRDALNDAIQDATEAALLIERQRSLEEIREEMAQTEDGRTGVYYCHPDVHYVRKGEAAAKLASLTGPCIVIEDDELADLDGQPATEVTS